jgi:hypothetical protein
VARALARHVAVMRAPKGIPAFCRIPGFTKIMYAMVINVVIPARTSVRTSVPASFR